MQRVLLAIDRVNTWVGKAFAWSILALTLVIAYEVFARYVFQAPTGWDSTPATCCTARCS